MKTVREKLLALLERAYRSGLSEVDVSIGKIFYEYNEYGLCFETIIGQMYESGIGIDEQFYVLLDEVGKGLQIAPKDYEFMKQMIRYTDERYEA